jgi:hypothetical protein
MMAAMALIPPVQPATAAADWLPDVELSANLDGPVVAIGRLG